MTGQKWQYKKPAPTPGKVCKDCVADWRTDRGSDEVDLPSNRRRPAPHPGPRCTTHHNAEKRRRRLAAKQRHVSRTYELEPEEYDALYEYQGGRCALCRVARGKSKRLAVDHDHHQALLDGHDPAKGCRRCIRALVCSSCNDVLAHARSMSTFFELGVAYLKEWPMTRMMQGKQWPPD